MSTRTLICIIITVAIAGCITTKTTDPLGNTTEISQLDLQAINALNAIATADATLATQLYAQYHPVKVSAQTATTTATRATTLSNLQDAVSIILTAAKPFLK
jgi:hypothetical protein